MRMLSVITGLVLLAAISKADDQPLIRLLPADANTVYVLRLQEMLKSPQGEKAGWNYRLEQEIKTGTADLPAWLETMYVAALTHPNVPEEVWAAGVFMRPEQIGMAEIAAHLNTVPVQLAGKTILPTERGSYLVDFEQQQLGFYRPAHRQELANWIRESATQPPLPDYLQQALNNPAHLVMSLNLQDMLDPVTVRLRLEQDERFAQQRKLLEQLVPLLSSLRGVTLAATVTEGMECQIQIDFDQPVGSAGAIIKTLFLAIIEDSGAYIEEFPDSRITSQDHSVKLTCSLSEASLRRLISIIVPPRTPATAQTIQPPAASNTVESDVDVTVRANRKYLEAINKMIEDLYRASRRANSYTKTITWHQTFAQKIEALPSEHVRPELISFGQQTARHFRALASSLRGQEIQVVNQNNAITYNITDLDPGWASASYWGGFGYRPPTLQYNSNLQQVREKQAEAVTAGQLQREKIWEQIRADQAKIQQLLNSKK